jgi:hypothetical protein
LIAAAALGLGGGLWNLTVFLALPDHFCAR